MDHCMVNMLDRMMHACMIVQWALIAMVARRTVAAEYHVVWLASTDMMFVCTCECSTHMVGVPSSLRCREFVCIFFLLSPTIFTRSCARFEGPDPQHAPSGKHERDQGSPFIRDARGHESTQRLLQRGLQQLGLALASLCVNVRIPINSCACNTSVHSRNPIEVVDVGRCDWGDTADTRAVALRQRVASLVKSRPCCL
jgi:hypothetical protein